MCDMNPFVHQLFDACAPYGEIISGLPVQEVGGGR
jgi:hypothetical protein